MEEEYIELLSRIASELNPRELEIMKFSGKKFMPYKKSTHMETGSTECLSEVFDFLCKIEEKNKLGIDNLDWLKRVLEQLKKEELVLEVVKFQFQRKAYLSSLGVSEPERGESNQTTRNERGRHEEEEQQPRENQRNQNEANREGQQEVDQSSRGTVVMQCILCVGGAVWVAGSIYLLNRHKDDTKALETIVSKVVIPIGELFMKKVYPGSINFLLQATDLNSLKELWKRYKTGQLKDKLEQVMVTEELKNLANGEQIELVVTISEAEYRNACLDLMVAQSQAQTHCKRIISSLPTLQTSRSLPDLTSLDATHDLSHVMHFGELLKGARMKKKSIHTSAGKSPSNLLRKETVLSLLQLLNSIKSKIKFFPGFDIFVSPLSGATFGLGRMGEYKYYYRSLTDNPDYKLLLDLLQEVNTFLDGRNVLILPEKAVKDLFFFVSQLKNVNPDEIDWCEVEYAMKRMAFDYPWQPRHRSVTEIRENLNVLTKELKELAAFLVKEFNLDSRLLKDTQDEIGSLESPKMSSLGDDDDDDVDALRRKQQSLRSDTEKLVAEKTKDLEASKMGKGQRRIVSPITTGKTST